MQRRALYPFAVLILISTLLLPGLNQAFRSDEVWSLHTVAMPFRAMVDHLRADIHPPLYYLLLRPWTQLAGTSETGTRSLSVMMHLLAGLTIFLGMRRRLGTGAAVLSCAIFLSSPLGILSAQLVRMYSLLELTAALALVFWLRLVESEPRPKPADFCCFVAACIAGTFTHIWFFFLLAAIAVVHLARWRTRRLGWMSAAAALGLAPWALLWFPTMIRQSGHTADNLAWLRPPSFTAPVEVVLLQGGVVWLMISGALLVFRRRPRPDGATLLVWVSTLAIPFGISLLWQPVFWARFTVVALPAFSIAAGSLLASRMPPNAALTALLILASLFTAGQHAVKSDECDARWTATLLSEHVRPGDAVIFTNLSRLPVGHYWRNAPGITVRSLPAVIDEHPGFEGRVTAESLRAEADATAAGLIRSHPGGRVYLFHGFRPELHRAIVDVFDRHFRRENAACLKCPAMLNYYDEITVWNIPAADRPADGGGGAGGPGNAL